MQGNSNIENAKVPWKARMKMEMEMDVSMTAEVTASIPRSESRNYFGLTKSFAEGWHRATAFHQNHKRPCTIEMKNPAIEPS